MASVSPSARAQHVILVEDDEDVRHSLTMLLRSWGYSVESFCTGVELLSTRKTPTAGCIIIDYKMPHMDGLALLKRLRQAGFSAPAILITGVYSTSLAARAEALGFAEVIEKPGVNSLLQTRLEAAFASTP